MADPPDARLPPKPRPRPEGASLLTRLLLARRDILSSQPARLYRAWVARQPLIRRDSFLVNQPDLVRTILEQRPDDFPKSALVARALSPLLGRSVFVTSGETWRHQRSLIDPAFQAGNLGAVFPAFLAAGEAALGRLRIAADRGPVEVEVETAHLAADIIFRTLFSLPIEDAAAARVHAAFRAYQRCQPLLTPVSLLGLPQWLPFGPAARSREPARRIRALLTPLVQARAAEIAAGTAPDDLATRIMQARDPDTGSGFGVDEMVDQIAIFFLAGHETSASALAWALYLLATHPDAQDRAAAEAEALPDKPAIEDLRRLPFIRDVFRETLRLYPPVPMLLRDVARSTRLRSHSVRRGALVVLSPWHLHRHERLWDRPDAFDPGRWSDPAGREAQRDAYLPFSRGPRICTGAGFAMTEGVLSLALILRRFRLAPVPDREPVPVAHLTLRARDGIWLGLTLR